MNRHNSYITKGAVVASSSLLALTALSACAPDEQNWGGVTCYDWHEAEFKSGTPLPDVARDVITSNPNLDTEDIANVAMMIARANETSKIDYNSQSKQLIVSVGSLAVPTICNR